METNKERKTARGVPDEPMTDKHRDILRQAKESLVKDMNPDNVLLKMTRSNVFTEDEEETIKGKGVRHKQCIELLDTLMRRGDRAYDIFKNALEEDHPHLANVILTAENDQLQLELRRERTNSAKLQKKALERDELNLELIRERKNSARLQKALENEELNLELTRHRTGSAILQNREKQTCSQCCELKRNLDALNEQMKTDLQNNDLQKQQVEKLKKRNDEIESKRKKLEKEKSELKRQLNQSQQKLEKAQDATTKIEILAENLRKAFKETLKKAEPGASISSNEIYAFYDKAEIYMSKMSENLTQQGLDDKEPRRNKVGVEEIMTLREAMKDKDTKIVALEENNSQLESEWTQTKNQLTEAKTQLTEAKNQLKEEKKNREKAVKEKKALQLNVDEERKEKETLEKRLNKAETEIKKCVEKYEDLKKRFDGEAHKFGMLSNEKNECERKWKEAKQELRKSRRIAEQTIQDLKTTVFQPSVFVPNKESYYSEGVLHHLNQLDSYTKLDVSRSTNGPGNARDVLNRDLRKPSGTKEEKDSWWCVDLGEDYLLAITHFTLIHGKSKSESVLSRWKIEGSTDGKRFQEIEKNEKIDNPPGYSGPKEHAPGRWSVSNGKVGGVFRFFRIFQTGTNTSHKYGIYLSGVELYGVLFKI